MIERPDMYAAMTLPPQLDAPNCPRSEFEFVESPLPLPPHLAAAATPAPAS